MTPRAWLSAAVGSYLIYAPAAALLGLVTWLEVAAVTVGVLFLCICLAGYRWAGKPVVRVSNDHVGALSWLDERDTAHRKP